jgi:outer membrane protein assembly factor BamB
MKHGFDTDVSATVLDPCFIRGEIETSFIGQFEARTASDRGLVRSFNESTDKAYRMNHITAGVFFGWTVLLGFACGALAAETEAQRVLADSGVQGGLVVHLGCGDGRLTAALGAGEGFVVQGLDRSPAQVETARRTIQSLGLYGKVSVDRWDGTQLPYIDNLVNLIVAEDAHGLSDGELLRVLAPRGVAYLKQEGNHDVPWRKLVKPQPPSIDEWTHYLHDPLGTMVSRDAVVGPPRRMQWVGDPKWMRNHDFMCSLSGMVSAGGRIFYIIDEGLRQHIYLPGRWALVARDAFNGTLLWKRPIDEWFPHTWPFKSGPAHLPRRIVAVGDRVYVTLGLTAPLCMLEAATGRTIRTYEATKATEEAVVDDGVLYLLVDPDKQPFVYRHAHEERGAETARVNHDFGWPGTVPPRQVMAVSAQTGEVLWKHRANVAPLTLAIDATSAYFFDGEHVVALDRADGRQRWLSEPAGLCPKPATGYAPRLIVGPGMVVLSTPAAASKDVQGRLVGVSTESGKVLWRTDQVPSGHYSPEDLYLIGGLDGPHRLRRGRRPRGSRRSPSRLAVSGGQPANRPNREGLHDPTHGRLLHAPALLPRPRHRALSHVGGNRHGVSRPGNRAVRAASLAARRVHLRADAEQRAGVQAAGFLRVLLSIETGPFLRPGARAGGGQLAGQARHRPPTTGERAGLRGKGTGIRGQGAGSFIPDDAVGGRCC